MSSEYVNSIKKYVIHISSKKERRILVDELIDITGAEIYNAVQSTNGALGCYLSHLEIYKKNPTESVIVFEDDCVINDINMLSLLDDLQHYDLVYFGIIKMWNVKKGNNANSNLNSYGTHAMWISSRAIQFFLEYTKNKAFHIPIDHLWNKIENKENLLVWRPSPENIYKYCEQKNGLISSITKKKTMHGNKIDPNYVPKKCMTAECVFIINKDITNNNGNHCCFYCWKKTKLHGAHCSRMLYTPIETLEQKEDKSETLEQKEDKSETLEQKEDKSESLV